VELTAARRSSFYSFPFPMMRKEALPFDFFSGPQVVSPARCPPPPPLLFSGRQTRNKRLIETSRRFNFSPFFSCDEPFFFFFFFYFFGQVADHREKVRDSLLFPFLMVVDSDEELRTRAFSSPPPFFFFFI